MEDAEGSAAEGGGEKSSILPVVTPQQKGGERKYATPALLGDILHPSSVFRRSGRKGEVSTSIFNGLGRTKNIVDETKSKRPKSKAKFRGRGQRRGKAQKRGKRGRKI